MNIPGLPRLESCTFTGEYPVAKIAFQDSVVPVKLWGGLIADVRLPLLILFGFLLGWVPTLLVYRAKMWSLRRRYEPIEALIARLDALRPAE